MLKPGIYEQVITRAIKRELRNKGEQEKFLQAIDQAESHKVLTHYLYEIIEQGLSQLKHSGKEEQAIHRQVELTNKIVDLIRERTSDDSFLEQEVHEDAEELLMLLGDRSPLKKARDIPRPETSIARSSLFTGAADEPQLYSELTKEIKTSDRVDLLVSFIKWSGLRLLMEDLKSFTNGGGQLRIITTSYMGATDLKAIVELQKLANTRIKISYDATITRLHAKTYIFHRDSGYSTAYIGSSNVSRSALTSGLEWNVKLTKKDLPDTFSKMLGTFETYWNSPEFEYYMETDEERLSRALKKEQYKDNKVLNLDLRPFSFQQEILDHLEAEREVRGHFKNLVIAATGTGKTMISAFDYKRFRAQRKNESSRLLFIAHRKEILQQSLLSFRAVLQDPNFGDLFVGRHSAQDLEHVFMSIQTFNSMGLISLVDPEYFDYIVVDEFHHAAANSYQNLLNYFNPHILLGLTATPERMDGKDVFGYFDDRIAAEIRLPEAIDRKLLVPFHYFGVSDVVDLSTLKWGAGGYDVRELNAIYTMSGVIARKRAELVLRSIKRYVTDVSEMKGLGFCVSIDHAKFMADHFTDRGIPSLALSAISSDEERDTAKERLRNGEIKIIFVIDLYNEGVDIPEVNTVLFLRPTESLTIFLQQLGRGLRLSEEKECLTVLDFIGQAHKNYRFEEKFKALQLQNRQSIQKALKVGFQALPKGSYIQLEKVATTYILDNIKTSLGNKRDLVNKVRDFEEETGRPVTLKNFLDYYHLEAKNIYKYISFSELKILADILDPFKEPVMTIMKKAFIKLAVIDSRRLIKFLLEYLPRMEKINIDSLTSIEETMLHMFYATIWGETLDLKTTEVQENLRLLSQSPRILSEIQELLDYRFEQIDFIDQPVLMDIPLDLHCSYTRDQILVAMDFFRTNAMREGVKWLPDKQCDLLFVTLNKSNKDYSPSTMYDDYSINEQLFHWQSQSTTSEDSPTGMRYRNHVQMGSKVLLFVRENKKDSFTGSPEQYTFLGLVDYVSHEGSKPMSIIWKLQKPIAAKLLKKTNKLAVS